MTETLYEKLNRKLKKAVKRMEKENLRVAIQQQKQTGRAIDRFARRQFDLDRGLQCKYCGSTNLVRYGTYQGIQKYLCKDCGHTFTDNAAIPYMHTPLVCIGAALSAYYRGMSLEKIRRHLDQQYGITPSKSTLYYWLIRFSKIAIEEAKKYKPEVGNVWVADETVLRVSGKKIDRLKKGVWFWDIIDSKTRFLLASHLSQSRRLDDAEALMDKAWRRAGKSPRIILTDKLAAYLDGISIVFNRTTTKHIQSEGFTSEPNTNLIERFHGSLKERIKIMRGLKSMKTARLLLDGWLVHYNFFRPHESLKGKTPAQVAGIKFPYSNWLGVVRQGNYPTHKNVNAGLAVSNIGYQRKPARRSSHRAQARKPKARKRATVPTIGVVKQKYDGI